MNQFQKKLLEVYACGEYDHLVDTLVSDDTGQLALEIDSCGGLENYIQEHAGDTLLLFLYRELGDDGDMAIDEYIERLEQAKADIQHVLDAIEDMQPST